MGSGWTKVRTVFRKELRSELRSRSGLLTAGLFGLVATVVAGFAGLTTQVKGSMAGALLWVVVLFAGVIALPRTFLAEEEQGTADWLRLLDAPQAIFWGKALFNVAQMSAFSLLLVPVLLALLQIEITSFGHLILGLVAGILAMAGSVTLVGALVSQAANRAALAGAVALPLLVPLVILGVSAVRVGLGEGSVAMGTQALAGLWCYAVAAFAIGPILFEAVWRE